MGLLREHLLQPDTTDISDAQLVYARWKPGVSVIGLWDVQLADGRERVVSLKLHLSSAQAKTASYERVNEDVEQAAAPLAAFARLPDPRGVLVAFPADRSLRGLARVMNLRKCARILDETELWRPLVLRRRSSQLELLRFKPERRAVFRLRARLKWRGEQSPAPHLGEAQMSLALRVLTPAAFERALRLRDRIEVETAPRLLHAHAPTATLFEEWLEGEPHAPDDFHHAREAGACLARMHRAEMSDALAARDRASLTAFTQRIEGFPSLAGLPMPALLRAECLVHGDFHPDQCVDTPDGLRLLDLDEIRAGVPEEDLADWIADALSEQRQLELSEAAAPLFEGYREAGGRIEGDRLRALVCEELLERAVAGMRRLERGAVERARALIERARLAASEPLER